MTSIAVMHCAFSNNQILVDKQLIITEIGYHKNSIAVSENIPWFQD